jgi:hypothetical protein
MDLDEDRDLSGENLVRAHTASNEIEALAIEAMLEAEGIDTAVQSRQIPMYDGIAQVFNPAWGYILVRESDLAKAKILIETFLDIVETTPFDGEDAEEDEE